VSSCGGHAPERCARKLPALPGVLCRVVDVLSSSLSLLRKFAVRGKIETAHRMRARSEEAKKGFCSERNGEDERERREGGTRGR